MDFTPLEREVLNWIANHSEDPSVASQIRNAKAVSRQFNGHGSFTELCVVEEQLPVSFRVCPVDPHIESPDLEAGAGCVLFFKDGRASLLELYAYGAVFPETLTSWTLS